MSDRENLCDYPLFTGYTRDAMQFLNRSDAGHRLGEALSKYRGQSVVVLALPRGGVPVALEVARALAAPLDLVLVRKIGLPMQPELAMGAVVDGPRPYTVRNEDVIRLAGVTEAEFAAVRDREIEEIRRRRAKYLGARLRAPLDGRVVIVVDDGIATGATIKAALQSVRKQMPRKVIIAVPVAPASSIADLRDEVDDLVCLDVRTSFDSVGLHYADFTQVSDEQVTVILAQVSAT
jgi:putative phosphoribosyl transferase